MSLKQCVVFRASFAGALVGAALCVLEGSAATVAMQDFDGGAINLISGFDPSTQNLDGGSGDFFGVGNVGAWPQGYPPGMPFSLADDSVVSVSNLANPPFPTDNEGLMGQNRAPADNFFAISDTRDFEANGQPSASWTFNIGGFSGLFLSIDMGAQASEASGGFPTSSSITFTYQIDGGPVRTAFAVEDNSNVEGIVYRAMDSGLVPAIGTNGPLQVSGPNILTKVLADTGAVDGRHFLNKTPASGNGAGLMDTFSTAINGTGSQLVLTMTADLDFEAMGFDNIKITGVPEPTSAMLLLIGLATMRLRRTRA